MSNLWNRTLSAKEAEAYLGPQSLALFRMQLLIAAVNKAGGKLTIPVDEVDGTGAYMMEMAVDHPNRTFTLTTRKKQ